MERLVDWPLSLSHQVHGLHHCCSISCCLSCSCTRAYADSKTLTEPERARLFKALAADTNCVYAADLLSAAFISGQMLGRARVSLNAVAEQSTIGLIQSVLDAGVHLKQVSTWVTQLLQNTFYTLLPEHQLTVWNAALQASTTSDWLHQLAAAALDPPTDIRAWLFRLMLQPLSAHAGLH